jgi:hypothetical protein
VTLDPTFGECEAEGEIETPVGSRVNFSCKGLGMNVSASEQMCFQALRGSEG